MPPESVPPASAPLSRYGSCGGRSALARQTPSGTWQVKVHDPRNALAGHDGWVLLGVDWPSMEEACAATGLS